MTVTAKTLVASKIAENAQTTQYTATNVRTIIDKFTATNYSAGAITLSINSFKSGSMLRFLACLIGATSF